MKNYNHNTSMEAATNLSLRIIDLLKKAIDQKDAAVLVVSGGSTPKPMFNHLSKQELDWSKVTVTLADERCVDPSDSESNALLVKEELLQNKAKTANFVSLFDGGKLSLESQEIAHNRMCNLPRYDVVILGMGGDGHTASIFPKADNRAAALSLSHSTCALATDPKTVSPMRITQTASRLLNSDLLIIHISGAEKSELFDTISSSPDEEKWPISAFITQDITPVELYQSGANSTVAYSVETSI